MAGFGVSVLDIAKAISLAKEIYDKCYTETPASTRYREFLNSIKALGDSLERLESVVRQHEAQYPHRSWHRGSSYLDESQNLWERLVGDFYLTLKECESVLARQGYLRDGRQRTFDNLRWWFSAEDTVDKLSARLRRHVQNIDFYSKPSEFETMIRHGRDVQQLRRQLANMEQIWIYGVGKSPKPGADLLSSEMEARLKFAFEENRPEWSTDDVPWPLRESFQAFAFHFAQGTVKLQPQKDVDEEPSPIQYLELVKSAWILENIRQSPHFKSIDINSRWADFMREFEDDIRGQQNRFEIGQLRKPAPDVLSRLQIGKFGVNKGNEDIHPDPFGVSESGIPEEKIIEAELVEGAKEQDCILSVFRQTDSDFRLMTSTRQMDALAPHSNSFDISMEKDRLIPVYGHPKQQGHPRHSLVVLNQKGMIKREYSFAHAQHVQTLQRALTGYRVHHEMRITRWCINGSSSSGNFGDGVIQLWQCKSLPVISGSGSSQSSDATSSLDSAPSLSPSFSLPGVPKTDLAEPAVTEGDGYDLIDYVSWQGFPNAPIPPSPMRRVSLTSNHQRMMQTQFQNDRRLTVLSGTTMNGDPVTSISGRSSSNTSKVAVIPETARRDDQSGTSMNTRASIMSPVKGGRTDGTQLTKPQLPSLVIFTEIQGKYSFIHLTLEPRVEVQPKSCACRKKDKKCNRVVLEPTTRDPFSLRILSAEQRGEEGLRDWDISAFRYPPASEKLKKITLREKVKMLELQFADHIEKKLFLDELQLLINVRTADHNEYEQSLRHKARKAAKPASKH